MSQNLLHQQTNVKHEIDFSAPKLWKYLGQNIKHWNTIWLQGVE